MGRRTCTLLLSAGLLACWADRDVRTYEVRGVVRGVEAEARQVVVQHEDIEGLMPAMTMNFDVAAAELLEGLETGQPIRFRLEATRRGYRILELEPLATGTGGEGDDLLAELVEPEDRAPAFALTDQQGRRLALADLSGKVVLLDFVFTRCPGPCPVLTGLHVDAQRALPEDLRERAWFVSISIDPEHDDPEALRAYAEARGADLSGWSFLTGEPADVAEVIQGYGVGRIVAEDAEIQHTVATFVIDPEGRIVQRFLGLDHRPEEIVRALRRAAG